MKKFLILATFFADITFGNTLSATPPRVLQDPETKVAYYLESDGAHVAAISPDGKLLWCCEVIPAAYATKFRITQLALHGDNIDVTLFMSGYGVGEIKKTTGTYSPPVIVQ